MKNKIAKIILINFLVVIFLLITLELIARTYISKTRGNATAGLPERNSNLKYEPFVMFGKDWNKIYKDFSDYKKKEDELYILLIGGSTAQGFPIEILENEISKILKKGVKVFNSAHGSYISTQELILIIRYANLIKPDLIINLNTANDITHSLRKNNLAGTFSLNGVYKNILTKPYLAPFIYILQQSQLFNGLIRLQARKQEFEIENYRDHIDVLVQNMNNIYLFCEGSNILYLNVMQPHVVFKNVKHENEENFKIFDYRARIVKELYNLAIEKKIIHDDNFLDTRFVFNDNPSYIFSDDVHFVDDKGYTVLAEVISEKINTLLNIKNN